jgi:hypothetical protein
VNVEEPTPGSDDHDVEVEVCTRGPRRRLVVAAAVCAAVAVLAGAAAMFAERRGGEAHDPNAPYGMVAPEGELDLATVSDGVAAEFHYAADHLDVYRQLRCWCGCEKAFRHANLAACFVRPDGQWEAHGAGCGVCIASAIVGRERLEAGVAIADIAAEIDRTYGPDPTFTKEG